jgi:Rrf2 family protein
LSYSLAFSQSLFVVFYIAAKILKGVYEFIPTHQIATDLKFPPSTVAVILRRLNRAGLLETREGANGGVRLALPPNEISLLDIFKAIEQERPLFQMNIELKAAGEKPTIIQDTIFQRLNDAETAMKEQLGAVTIQQLIDDMSS